MGIKDILIDEIITYEREFFLAVNNRGGTASCQENPESFVLVRRMGHVVQSESFLESYLQDLKNAKNTGRNIMTEKYALMENLIARTNFDAHIEEIVEIEASFQEEMYRNYPHIVGAQNMVEFRNYLACELQTLSSTSLTLYYEHLKAMQHVGRNLAKERYNFLMESLGRPQL